MRHRGKPVRRGYSLVEMLAVMASMTVVMGLCVVLLELVLKLDTSGREHVDNEATIARLGRVFRGDVRGASEVARCDPGKDSSALALRESAGDRAVEYLVLKDRIVRAEWVAGELLKQEQFLLPPRSSARFARRDPAGLARVALVFERRGKKGDGRVTVHEQWIEASPGSAGRFSPAAEASR
jgi:hypothetical protein